jgi:hypothetical protein
MWKKIIMIIFFTSILTLFFLNIPNKSNFPKKMMIPILVSLIIKYSMGDLDKGYHYTSLDILHWILIIFIPYMIVVYFDTNN